MDVVGTAVGGIIGGSMQSNAAQKAAQTQANAQLQAQQEADTTQMNMFNTEQGELQPYLNTGNQALSSLNTALAPGGSLTQNFSLSNLQTDPGYLFDLQQGNQAVQRSAAANGTLNSGGTLKAISNYTTGLASNEINNAYNRYTTDQNNQFNRLSAMASLGSNAAATLTGAAQNTGNQIANTQLATTVGAGNANAAGTVGSSNAISQAITGAANNYSQYTTLNRILSSVQNPNTNLATGGTTRPNTVALPADDGENSALSQIQNWSGGG